MVAVHSVRPGDHKTLIGAPLDLRSKREGVFSVEWWMVAAGREIFGVGFTITGQRRTDFLTWSEYDPWHVWTEDDQVHVVTDLCRRGLVLSEDETQRFLVAWKGDPVYDDGRAVIEGVFGVYQRSRRASPPKTYTLEQAMREPFGKPIRDFLDRGLRSPLAGPVTRDELEPARKDLA